MFGGADPAVPNLVPSNIEIRRNFLYKPREWFGRATIKASIELKNARNVVIDGNVIESGGLVGAFVLTVRNQGGTGAMEHARRHHHHKQYCPAFDYRI